MCDAMWRGARQQATTATSIKHVDGILNDIRMLQHNHNATPVLGRNRSPTKCCCCKQEPLCSVPCDCSRWYANNCQYCCVSACFVDTSCGRRSSYASRSICGTIFALCIVCLLMAVMLDMLMWVVGIATLVLCTPCILMVLLIVIVQS
jgi:hypothetical protein